MFFNGLADGLAVSRVRIWLFALAVVLLVSHRASDAQRIAVAQAECPASMSKAVRRFFALAPQAPRAGGCAKRPDQRAVLSRASPIQES